jgi:hypothetical protein
LSGCIKLNKQRDQETFTVHISPILPLHILSLVSNSAPAKTANGLFPDEITAIYHDYDHRYLDHNVTAATQNWAALFPGKARNIP